MAFPAATAWQRLGARSRSPRSWRNSPMAASTSFLWAPRSHVSNCIIICGCPAWTRLGLGIELPVHALEDLVVDVRLRIILPVAFTGTASFGKLPDHPVRTVDAE